MNYKLTTHGIGVALGAMTLCGCATDVEQKQPNIIVILADDMGFSDLGCYGGEIETPNLNKLAENGIRYKQFYNTARSCPSRAMLITGLYPHQAGMGWMANADLQTPAYQGYINQNCVTFADVTGSVGYKTYMSGKWHVSSDRQNQGGVIDNWPNQRGFDCFYGIVGGAANYYQTTVNIDNEREKSPDDGSFYFTHAISDAAVGFIDEHSFQDNPLFMYVAYTAPHWPLHALQEDIDKYVERYKVGWDVLREERFQRQKEMGLFDENTILSPRDSRVPAWETLSDDKKQEFAMRMAIYAAQIDALDQGVGRIVAKLEQEGELDNTMIMFMSDNGACAEHISSGNRKDVDGKEDTYESYRINWANLSSTPYREYKHYTNEGGIASPLIIHYPEGIDKNLNNTFISDYGHFTDVMATCVDLSGATYPKTVNGHDIVPMQGVSLVPNFTGGKTSRTVTFWEHEANIAMRDGKWKMVTKTHEGDQFNPDLIELYDMEKDPTEMNDLAKIEPERTAEMYDKWNTWAEEIGVFPLDTRMYGVRAQTYKRKHINGDFKDNFGDWGVVTKDNSGIEFSIEEKAPISGDKSARIKIGKGDRGKPMDAHLKWVFMNHDAGTVASVGFDGKASKPTTLTLRFEKVGEGNNGGRLLEEKITLSDEVSTHYFENLTLPSDGRYQLMFLFGDSDESVCLIDNVKLDWK